MGLLASCSDEVLSAAWLLLLFSSTALCDCPTPVLPPHSSLRTGGVLPDTSPVGNVLHLQCITGYEIISGTNPKMTCLDTNKWSELPTLCQGKRCPVPHIDNGRIVSSDDLRLGEEVILGCEDGFRIIGGNARRCVLQSGRVNWNRDLPICERIPCARPPEIANGVFDRSATDSYDVGWIIIYRCNADYSLIGNSTITCIVAENGVDGKWDWPSPECKRVKCHRPRIPNGKVASVFQETYTYENKLPIECDPGYTFVGPSSIMCDADSQWKPSGPWCEKRVKCHRPRIPNGKVASVFQETYTYENKLPIECDPGYTFVGPSLIMCDADSQWKPSGPWCEKIPATSKSPTPAVTPTLPISLKPGTVTPKEDSPEVTTTLPTTTQETPKVTPGSASRIGIAIGAVLTVIVVAALILIAVKKCPRQGKANVPSASTDNYRVVSDKETAMAEK